MALKPGDVRRSGRQQWPLLWAYRLHELGVLGKPANTKVGITIDTTGSGA